MDNQLFVSSYIFSGNYRLPGLLKAIKELRTANQK
jgi:hypothetical protein